MIGLTDAAKEELRKALAGASADWRMPVYRPVGPPNGNFKNCYICGCDLKGLSEDQVSRSYRTHGEVPLFGQPLPEASYTLSTCKPCAEQYLRNT